MTTLTLGGLTGNKDFARVPGSFPPLHANNSDTVGDRPDPQPRQRHCQLLRRHRQRRGRHDAHQDRRGHAVLSNSNTYSGATAIDGGTLVITGATQATSAITFGGGVLGLDTATTVAAASATVDFTGQSVLVSGPTGAPSYTLLTASLDHRHRSDAGRSGSFRLRAASRRNQLLLVQTGGDSLRHLGESTHRRTPDDDFDGDGVSNAVEFVLGGDKDTNDLDKLPAVVASGGNMTFSFVRDQSSIDASTVVTIEVSTDLVTWDTAPSPYAVPDTATAGLPSPWWTIPTAPTPSPSPWPKWAPDPKKFARLKVVIVP